MNESYARCLNVQGEAHTRFNGMPGSGGDKPIPMAGGSEGHDLNLSVNRIVFLRESMDSEER